jgi:predicted enzyme related to lactoylglutathione lyase
MEMIRDSFNWLEIPVLDFDRAKKFYSAIYDFEMQDMMMGNIRMGFLLVEEGRVGGAICFGEGYEPAKTGTGPKVYLNGGEDLSVVLDRVEGAGGKVLMPKTEIDGNNGFMAMIHDSEGNELMLHSMK